jgi:hypothetical protein
VPIVRTPHLYPSIYQSHPDGVRGESELLTNRGGGVSVFVHLDRFAHLVFVWPFAPSSDAYPPQDLGRSGSVDLELVG